MKEKHRALRRGGDHRFSGTCNGHGPIGPIGPERSDYLRQDAIISIPLSSGDIPQGESVEVFVECQHIFIPTHFVFSGTKDLWLSRRSAFLNKQIYSKDMPLDTFRVGAPLDVSWPTFEGSSGSGANFLEILNLSKGRNAPMGKFAGRLVGRLPIASAY